MHKFRLEEVIMRFALFFIGAALVMVIIGIFLGQSMDGHTNLMYLGIITLSLGLGAGLGATDAEIERASKKK